MHKSILFVVYSFPQKEVADSLNEPHYNSIPDIHVSWYTKAQETNLNYINLFFPSSGTANGEGTSNANAAGGEAHSWDCVQLHQHI